MDNTPSVCIVIPTYNQAAYITKAVESVLEQDYPNLEILVADDNSTDNTERVLEEYIQSKKIRYKKNSTNLGRVANYRECLYENTQAEWVINLDGDDYYIDPHFISQAMNAIKDAGKERVLFYQGSHIYKKGNLEELQQPNMKEEQKLIRSEEYFFNYFHRQHFSHLTTLYNRNLAILSGFYEKDILSADIFSILQYCLNFADKRVIVSKNVSGVWLQHYANSSKTVQIKPHLDNFGGYKKLYSLALEKGFDKIRCLKWLMTARYMYLRLYAGRLYTRTFL